MNNEKTLGEKRVRTEFNISGTDAVSNFNNTTAALINSLEEMRSDEILKTSEGSNGKEMLIGGEKLRLISIAQTAYEEAAMWAVKAATA